MRSTLFALTLACLVALPVAVSAQECAELTVYIGDVTADAGETTYVPVKVLEDMIELTVEAFQFDFHYCLEYLDYTGFTTVGTMIEGLEDPFDMVVDVGDHHDVGALDGIEGVDRLEIVVRCHQGASAGQGGEHRHHAAKAVVEGHRGTDDILLGEVL